MKDNPKYKECCICKKNAWHERYSTIGKKHLCEKCMRVFVWDSELDDFLQTYIRAKAGTK
jgi:hypothetical protein